LDATENKKGLEPTQNAEGPEGSVGVNSRLSAVPEAKRSGAAENKAGIWDAEGVTGGASAAEPAMDAGNAEAAVAAFEKGIEYERLRKERIESEARAAEAQGKAEVEKNKAAAKKINAEMRQAERKWWRGLSAKAKKRRLLGALVVVAVLAVLGFVATQIVLPLSNPAPTSYSATSSLKSAVEVDKLSTVEYTYQGVAEKTEQGLRGEKVKYRIKYETTITAYFNMSEIEFTADETAKIFTAYLPDPQITVNAPTDASKISFMPDNANANISDVLALCQQDAQAEYDNQYMAKQATTNLQHVVEALTLPIVENEGYELRFDSLANYQPTDTTQDAEGTNAEGGQNEAE
jgi:hypothetical protein